MGTGFFAKCRDCGNEFGACEGGGMTFHVLHCDRCGKSRDVPFEKISELHDRWLKKSDNDAESLSDDEYYTAVEETMRKCRCGGKFTFAAGPRCPECRSENFEKTGGDLMYD